MWNSQQVHGPTLQWSVGVSVVAIVVVAVVLYILLKKKD